MDAKWDGRFLEMAALVSTWSKDPSTKVGAIAVDPEDRTILATGYNGFPKGIDDSSLRLNNREEKYKYVVHAEMNMIYNAGKIGSSLKGSYVYVWGLPICSQCALGIVQSGVSQIILPTYMTIDEKWAKSWELSESIFFEAGIQIVRRNCR